MTPEEWDRCADPLMMLEHLRGKASDRKLWLLLGGWSRLNWNWMAQQTREAVEVAERFADGLVSDEDRESADVELWLAARDRHTTFRDWLVRLTLVRNGDLWEAARASASRNPTIKRRQAGILRDLFGNPFRPPPSVPGTVLACSGGAARRLAEAIYEGWRFEELPVLADLLEEAGLTDTGLLGHLRGPGPHALGCHALDLVLGKA
jgi:hypothetical protein